MKRGVLSLLSLLSLLSPLCLLVVPTTASPDGKYWWMGSGDAFGDSQDNQINNNQYQQEGQGLNNVLPVTQNLGQPQQGGSCPAVGNVPPVSQCAGRESNCWSVGQPDVDCLNNALCCFDGCANICQGSGSRSPAPPPNPRPAAPAQPRPQPQPQPRPKPQPRPNKQKQRPPVKKDPWPQQQQQPRQPTKPRPPVKQQQQPRQPANNFQQSSGGSRRPSSPAASKPFVRCPSAMKCVPRVNCNLEGVMVNEVLNYSPNLEMLRVPLIPCVNMMAGNTIDVCCRDPNYQDPWPDMNNNNPVNKRNGRRNNRG